ncbi:hypothetical protein CEXT_357321 [Caerostris extrusa]|uniref:Uncharacterized protein n=1 Tax=Caerostris extrusa TaxID=172846 RepID=A0AAV4YCD6_CAEEX|nr:hypothetical protein CEXT_357321 [Caerostris extrusa]
MPSWVNVSDICRLMAQWQRCATANDMALQRIANSIGYGHGRKVSRGTLSHQWTAVLPELPLSDVLPPLRERPIDFEEDDSLV